MSTPFASLANLTAVFNVPTGDQSVARSGNPQVTIAQQVAIAFVTASQGTVKRVERLDDGNNDSLILDGYWVNPSQAIAGLLAEQRASALYWNLRPGFSLPTTGFASVPAYELFVQANQAAIAAQGELLYLPTPPSPFGDALVTGDAFAGTMIIRSAWADVV